MDELDYVRDYGPYSEAEESTLDAGYEQPDDGDRSISDIRAAHTAWRAFHCVPENAKVFEEQREQAHRDIGVLLRALEQPVTPKQPAPAASETWVYNYTNEHSARHGGWHIRIRHDNGDCLAHALNEATAATIVTNHQTAALVGELVAALTEMLDIVQSEGHADSYVPQVTAATATLAHAAGRESGSKSD